MKRTTLEEKWAAQEQGADTGAEGDPEDGAAATDEANAEVAELQRQVAELRDQLLREKAEVVNFRERMKRDREERVVRARAEVLQVLLPVVDDFDRAVAADTDNPEAYREGVELILRSFRDAFTGLGVERIEPQGEAFDPNLHEAIEQRQTDEAPEGHVVAVYSAGYRLGDRLLRAATVAVARAPVDHDSSSDD